MKIEAILKSTFDNLTKDMNLTPQNKDSLWREFLSFLKNENDADKLSHYFIRMSDEEGNFIQKLDEYIDKDIEIDKTIIDNYWNESVQKLIEDWLKLKEITEGDGKIPFGNTKIEIADIKNANAGRRFAKNEIDPIFWVRPNFNVDNELYSKVRGLDKTISVLADMMNLQFTHTQKQAMVPNQEEETAQITDPGKWIRLIMPKYTRRVEVEDLNRNFWVIAQVTAAVSSYLFDDDSPLPNILKGLLSEIAQLWENILYLWAILALETQKMNTSVHVEMLPLPSSSIQNFNKYDFIEEDISANAILTRIEHLRDKYSDQNLCIIPYLRQGNYKHNYFNTMKIPYIYFYHQGLKEWKVQSLFDEGSQTKRDPFKIAIMSEYKVFDEGNDKQWGDVIFGIRELTNDVGYKFTYPYSNIEEVKDENGPYFYGTLRVTPHLSFTVTPTSLSLDLTKENYFEIVDPAAITIQSRGINVPIKTGKRLITIGEDEDSYMVGLVKETEWNTKDFSQFFNVLSIARENEEENSSNYSYYLGEIISSRLKSQPGEIKIESDFKMIKLGDYYPETLFKKYYKNLIEISSDNPIAQTRDQLTYGYGSYYINSGVLADYIDTNNNKRRNFYCYNQLYNQETFDKLDADDRNLEKLKIEGKDLTYSRLIEEGSHYIKCLYKRGILTDPQKPAIYAAKIGIGCWRGSGTQWSYGLVTNLFYWPGGEELPNSSTDLTADILKIIEVSNIGLLGLFDGYWTKNEAVFSRPSGKARWRRLSLTCDSLYSIYEGDKLSFHMNGGRLTWYDHNIEGATWDGRPHCTIELGSGDMAWTFSYVGETNPIKTSNGKELTKKLAPRAINVSLDSPIISFPNGSNYVGVNDFKTQLTEFQGKESNSQPNDWLQLEGGAGYYGNLY